MHTILIRILINHLMFFVRSYKIVFICFRSITTTVCLKLAFYNVKFNKRTQRILNSVKLHKIEYRINYLKDIKRKKRNTKTLNYCFELLK